jgi:hypothetical protein
MPNNTMPFQIQGSDAWGIIELAQQLGTASSLGAIQRVAGELPESQAVPRHVALSYGLRCYLAGLLAGGAITHQEALARFAAIVGTSQRELSPMEREVLGD